MNKCCKKPDVVNMDYRFSAGREADGYAPPVVIENRHCNNCGHHWWGGKEYTRKEWNQLMEAK